MMDKLAHLAGDFLRDLITAVQNRIAILRLRWQIAAEKIRNYDRMVVDLQGMMHALQTKDRQIDDLNRKLDEASTQYQALQNEIVRLREGVQGERADVVEGERRELFKKLDSVLVQLPSIRQAIENGADIDGRQVLDVVAPLGGAIRSLGFETIGEAGGHVPFDPRQHKPIGKGARSLQENDLVRVRYVGYRYLGDILAKAEVTAVLEAEKTT